MDSIKEIKKGLEEDKLILGSQRTIKAMQKKELSKVFLASNCPRDIKETIEQYGSIAGIPAVELEQPNDELGIICKKQFFISVIGIKSG